MNKSRSSNGQKNLADEATRDKLKLNPVWRGVGNLLIIAIPVASWFHADFLSGFGFENQLKGFNVLSFFWNHHFKKSIFERQKLEGVFFITCYLGLDLSY